MPEALSPRSLAEPKIEAKFANASPPGCGPPKTEGDSEGPPNGVTLGK